MEDNVVELGVSVDVTVIGRWYKALKDIEWDGSEEEVQEISGSEHRLQSLGIKPEDRSVRQQVFDRYMEGKSVVEILLTLENDSYKIENPEDCDKILFLFLDYLWEKQTDLVSISAEFTLVPLIKELCVSPSQIDDVLNIVKAHQDSPNAQLLLGLALHTTQIALLLTMSMLEETKFGERWRNIPLQDFEVVIQDDEMIGEDMINDMLAGAEEVMNDMDDFNQGVQSLIDSIPILNEAVQVCEQFENEKRGLFKDLEGEVVMSFDDIEAIDRDLNLQPFIAKITEQRDRDIQVLEAALRDAPIKPIPELIPMLPPIEEMPEIKIGDTVLCKFPCHEDDDEYIWGSGILNEIYTLSSGELQYRVQIDQSQITTKYPMRDPIVAGKHIAYDFELKWRLDVGERCVVRWEKEVSAKRVGWYSALIAEKPVSTNDFRYLVFFDDKTVAYVEPNLVRLVYRRSEIPCLNYVLFEKGDQAYYRFLRRYLKKFPFVPKAKIREGDKVAVLRDSIIYKGNRAPTAIDIDGSTVQLQYTDGFEEILFRGSERIQEMDQKEEEVKRAVRRPTVRRKVQLEYDTTETEEPKKTKKEKNQTARKTTTQRGRVDGIDSGGEIEDGDDNMEEDGSEDEECEIMDVPLTEAVHKKENRLPKSHKCSPDCERGSLKLPGNPIDYFARKLYPPFMIPLLLTWHRHLVANFNPKSKLKTFVVYESPCGKSLRNCDEIAAYLLAIESCLSVDYFCFDVRLRPCIKYKTLNPKMVIEDYSRGVERMKVECVNTHSIDEKPHMIAYSKRRFGKNEEVILTQTCSSCDCLDDCANTAKCACQQITELDVEALPEESRPVHGNKQYKNRRLYETILSGIYECNSNCQCSKNRCVNRVAQLDISVPLQLFKTKNKGWGVRTLVDLPPGQFICIYSGAIYTDRMAEEIGKDKGDEYFADLDLIAACEKEKSDYEDEAPSMTDGDNSDDDLDIVQRLTAQNKCKTKKKKKDKGLNLVEYFKNSDANYPFIVDAKMEGNIGRYMNHSCSPNVFVQNVFLDTHDLRLPDVSFFSGTFIHAGEELCWDYGYVQGSTDGKELLCRCGSQNCRKRLL